MQQLFQRREAAEKTAKDKYKEQKVAFVLEDVIKADTPTPEPVLKFGWNKDTKGNWTYVVDSKGTKATGWVNDQGTWYYLNKSGAMQTGWLKDGETWYFLESTGAMKASQWFEVSGKWYHVNGSGALSVNTTVDGYNVNANGEWV